MTSIALLVALLVGLPAESEAPVVAPLLVAVDFEAGTVPLGCFALWTSVAGSVVEGQEGCAETPEHVDVGDLLDVGDVPFRTWVTLDFEGALLSILDGELGVGFRPRIRVRRDLLPPGALGSNGTVRFDGQVFVGLRGGASEEPQPASFARGFEAAPAGAGAEHRFSYETAVPLRKSGVRGPYRYRVEGTLHLDLHVYSGAAAR